MIELSEAAMQVLTRSHRTRLRVESWLGEDLLSDDVPIDSGDEEGDWTSNVPERVTLTVPRRRRGESWAPIAVDHPLAANGQRLRVSLGIDLGTEVEWFDRGWFVIQNSTADGDSVSVEAAGLLSLVDEARLITPYQPSGTIGATIRGLVEPALTVVIDPALTDRAVPAGINFDDDRLGAVYELLDAWPADALVHPDGYLAVFPATQSTTPLLSLWEAEGGTIIESSASSSRDGAASVVVARGTTADGGQIQAVAYDYTSPQRLDGPFNPLPVPYLYESPLLTTVPQCTAAAQTILARRLRETAVAIELEMVPHPAIQVGDVLDVTTVDRPNVLCVVESLSLPYLGGGSQTMTVRSLS